MSRGSDWEDRVQSALSALNLYGRVDHKHTIVKTEAPVRILCKGAKPGTFVCAFTSDGMCDFEGGYRGRPVCIEAKQISSRRFPFTATKSNKIKAGQVSRLDATMQMGGVAGLLVRFLPKDGRPTCFAIPWVLTRATREKSFNAETVESLGAMRLRSIDAVHHLEIADFMDLCLDLGRGHVR